MWKTGPIPWAPRVGCGKRGKGVLRNPDEYLPSHVKNIYGPEESIRKKGGGKARDTVVTREMFPKLFSENGEKYPTNLVGFLRI